MNLNIILFANFIFSFAFILSIHSVKNNIKVCVHQFLLFLMMMNLIIIFCIYILFFIIQNEINFPIFGLIY